MRYVWYAIVVVTLWSCRYDPEFSFDPRLARETLQQ